MTDYLSDDIARLRTLFEQRGLGDVTVQISEEAGQLILERLQQLEDRADVLQSNSSNAINLPTTASVLAAAIDGVEVGNVFFMNDYRAEARPQTMEQHNDL